MLTIALILLIASLVVLVLAAIPVTTVKPNLIALGLALYVAYHVVSRLATP